MDDAALTARMLEGDVEAFAALVDRHYDDMARFACRMLGNSHDAEDAIQETFLSALGALPRYRERGMLRAWLYRILINQCRILLRGRRRRERHVTGDGDAESVAVAAPSRDAFDLHDALQLSLNEIPPLLREAFLLKYGEELDYHEMARLTGTSVPALKMRVKRACDALRPMLEVRLNG
jgi:RNA polymerase sigma-70 factor (ECF subfamily)